MKGQQQDDDGRKEGRKEGRVEGRKDRRKERRKELEVRFANLPLSQRGGREGERERTERETQAYDHQSIWDHHALACRLRAHRLVSSIHHIYGIQSSNRKINERSPASTGRPDPCIHPSIELPASSLPDMQEKKHFFLLSSPLSSFTYLSLLPLTAKCGVYTRRSAASLPSFLRKEGDALAVLC